MRTLTCTAAHCTNIRAARKAAKEGRDLVVHSSHYNGQSYSYWTYRVTELEEMPGGKVVGIDENGEYWEATSDFCEYAQTGKM